MNKPCKACPFKKTSVAGYLGEASYQPEVFLKTIEHSPIPCHLSVNWKKSNPNVSNSPVCLGSLQFHKNSCKQPREHSYANMVAKVSKNEEIFNWQNEFIEHHSKQTA